MATTAAFGPGTLDQIGQRAAQARPRRVILLAVAAAFWFAGFAAAKACHGLWQMAAWSFAAVRTGWVEAHGPSRRAQINMLEVQVAELTAALARNS